jgi:FkbM family methyltransferase
MIINYIINKIIRKNLYLYVFFIFIYKKFINYFLFVEKKNYFFIKNSRIKTVLDVGSNHFQICNIILSLNQKLKIFSFDPIVHEISFNNKLKNVKFYNYALGNKETKSLFYTPYYNSLKLDSLGSFVKQNIKNYVKNNLFFLKNEIYYSEKKVKIKKLDSHDIKFQFIKIDTEGFELPIIKGGLKLIKKNNPIILLEVNKNLNKINKILYKIGYSKFIYNFKLNKFTEIIKISKDLNDIFFLNKKSFYYLSE